MLTWEQPSGPAEHSPALQPRAWHLRPGPGSSQEDTSSGGPSLEEGDRSKSGGTKARSFYPLPWINPHQDCSFQIVVESQGKFSFSFPQSYFLRARNCIFFVSGSSYFSISHMAG